MSSVPSGLDREELWRALVETAHALLMYKNHKRYVEEILLKEMPDIAPNQLAIRLGIPAGEAIVLLSEIRGETGKPAAANGAGPKSESTTLFDYTS